MAMLSDPRACFGFVFFCLLLTKSFGDTIDDLIQFEEDLNDNKPDDDNPFRDDDLKDDNPVKEEESVIHLWQLKKTKWRTSLQPYDVNKDGKLSGLELISAYPEIERLIKTEDEESNWLNLIGIQNIGVVVAIVIGGAVLIYTIKALTAPSQQQLSDREKQFSSEKERWLNKLQGTQKHNEHVTDQGSNTHIDKPTAEKISTEKFDVNVSPESSKESSPKLRKRKPDAGRDLVTNKMARYQHLTAVRRQTANRSDNNSAGFCQQLLSDEDEIAENSSDEIVGNTRKRRQIDKVKVDVIEQKVANVSINGDTLCDSKSQNGGITTDKSVNKNAKKPVRNNKSSLVNAENYELLLDKNTEEKTLNAETVPVQLSREVRNETIMKIISFVLGCSTSVEDVTTINFKSQQKILRFSLLHLPAQRDDVAEKIQAIVKVVTVRQIDKVKYAVTCFDRSSEKLVEQMDSVTEEVCEFLIGYFIEIIVKEVNSVQDDEEEDELWKDFNSVFISKSSVQALTRIAGWVDDGIVISQHLLSRLLQHQDGAKFVRNLFHGAGKQLMSVKRIDEVIIEEGRILRALEILLSNANCGRLIGEIMEEEVKEASGSLGNFFEKSSIFGPLLSLTTVPMKEDKNLKQKSPRAQPFLELKGFPRPALSDIRFLESNIQGALQRCQNIVHKALMTVLKSKSTRESGLAWLASVINLNDIRSTWSPEPDSQLSIGCCDGYMLNFCPVLLELFMPAINSGDLLSRVDLDYSSSESCRLNFDFEICLAGGQIVSENSEERKIGKLSEAQQGKFNFLTESFHLCQRGLSVGVLPAMSHRNAQLRHLGQVLQQLKETTREEEIRKLQALISLMWEVSLIDPVLVRKMSQFYLCQAQLLLNLIESSEQGVDRIKLQKKLLSRIPEFCIKDMCVWFRLVAQYATYLHSDVLAGLSLAPFVDCCVALLSEQELMPGPVAASKVVSSLLSFVNSSSGRNDRNTGWGNGAKSSLAMMVFTCPSFMEKLGPALIRTYVNVDVVEGLDVDKDEFDKYTSRAEITLLVQELWDRFDSRTSILKLVGTKLFQNFLGSVLNTLLYMLHDALTRVANIRKMEQAKDNVEEWQRLSLRERTEKDMFLKREEEAAKVFMKSANNTLDFVEFLTKTEIVATCFTRQPLSHRAANAILGFLDSLCGAKSMDYKVKDEQKYNFDHCVLLNKIVSVILNIAEQDTSKTEGFVFSMATDDDFSPPTLEKALSVITRKFLAGEDSLESFSKLIQAMKEIQLPKGSSRDGDLKGDNCKRWQEQITSLTVDTEALGEAYKTELTNLRFDSSEIQESHSFHGNVQDISPGPSKIKTLMKEMKQLSSNLPVHPNAAIFVRQDEERIDLMRAMVTGPVDTPYSLGCFIFDIFFPNNYPNIPPLVKIITTGNGTVRFNPNLYSDGKVCLSLLGTWHAGDASEKWIPSKSSLYQVLVSIQSLILIPDPMFNEPGYEGLRSTAEGMGRSKAYNSKLRLWTVRHAMLGQLRSPPAGFEVLIRKHFKLQKNVVLKQCSSWLNDCEDPEEEKRLRSVVNDLREELSKLDECPGKKIAESELQEELAKSEDLKKTEASETCQLFEDDLSDDALYG